jgi:hypothetical protein
MFLERQILSFVIVFSYSKILSSQNYLKFRDLLQDYVFFSFLINLL